MSLARKGMEINVRPIPGFEAIDEAVGRAAEMGKPLHFTPGFGGLVAATFAGLEVLSHVTKLAAQYDVRLIVTVSQPETFAVTEQVMKQALPGCRQARGVQARRLPVHFHRPVGIRQRRHRCAVP